MTQAKALSGIHSHHDSRRFGARMQSDTSNAWLLWKQELRQEEQLQNSIDQRWSLMFRDEHNKKHRVLQDKRPRWNEPGVEAERTEELELV